MKEPGEAILYGILDLGYVVAGEVASVARRMLDAGVDVLQLRAKGVPEHAVADLARAIAPETKRRGIPLILNDHPHLVPETGADGAHVGQDDIPIAEARKLAGKKAIIGRSTHSVSQAVAAFEEGADYIGFGPLFATPTKPKYVPIGLGDIRTVLELVPGPVFCIGGIKLENLPSVLRAGAGRVVIVSGILQAPDMGAYVREVKRLMRETPHPKEN